MTTLRNKAQEALKDAQTRTTVILLVAITVTVLLFGVNYTGFLSTFNLINIVVQTAVISVVAFGMTALIVTKGIDLSVGSSVAFSGMVGALTLNATGSVALAFLGVLMAALSVAAVNGFLVAFLRINPFMATLGMMALAQGAAISLTRGTSIPVAERQLLVLGRESVLGVPYAIIAALAALVFFAVLMNKTLLGRWLFTVGGNLQAATASGIPVRLVQFLAYLLVGVTVALGTLITMGRTGSAQPMAGYGLEFSAITAAVIGGARLAGGRGSVGATLLGSIFVGVLSSGLSFAGVGQPMIYVYTGLLTIVAVIIAQKDVIENIRVNISYAVNTLRAHQARRSLEVENVTAAGERYTLTIRGVKKSFSGVEALKGISFEISSGEVLALMGENGAGKSTLVKVIAGNHPPTKGKLEIDRQPVVFAGPEDASKAGIAVIHQHFTLVPHLTVAQNLFLNQEIRYGKFGPLNRRRMDREAQQLLNELGMSFRSTDTVADLTVGQRQMIEIVRAVQDDAWLVIMDEPTSALSNREREHLYELIERLRERNTAIMYISHKMDEIYHLCSRAVVLRDGALVGDVSLDETPSNELVSMMVGRSVENVYSHAETMTGQVMIDVQGVSDGGRLKEANLSVRAGEVVGLVGLMGSGRTELLRTIAGLSNATKGTITVMDQEVRGSSLHKLSKRGLAFVPEDRHTEGIFPEMTVGSNMSLLWLRHHMRIGWLKRRQEARTVKELMERMGVRPNNPSIQIQNLSGGNQQKVVLGKWLALEPSVILLDDPTRGVDVGAKAEIHALVAEFKAKGAAVIVTSSEIPEVISVADRIVVMRTGLTVSEHQRGVTEEDVMQEAFGYEGEKLLDQAVEEAAEEVQA